jgi:hypothetical protein
VLEKSNAPEGEETALKLGNRQCEKSEAEELRTVAGEEEATGRQSGGSSNKESL